jgi:hypothetical protein
VAERTQLSPGGAIVIGLFFGIVGTLVLLIALGTFGDKHLSDGTPPWVGVAAGVMFLLSGLSVIVGYGIAGGMGPDGDLPPGTPLVVRIIQSVLGLGAAAMLASIASWIAVGSGARRFSVVGPLLSDAVNETFGRAVFGVGAVAMWAFTAAMLIINIRRLRRP